MLLHQVVFRSGQGALQVLPPLVDVIPEARLNLVIYHLRQGDSLLLCLSYVTQVVCFWFLSSLSLHCYCTVAGWLTLTLCNDALLFIAKDYLPLRSVTVIHIHHWSKGQRFHSLHGCQGCQAYMSDDIFVVFVKHLAVDKDNAGDLPPYLRSSYSVEYGFVLWDVLCVNSVSVPCK